MPTITASSSLDFSTSSSASSAGEEQENDVLFAALFGAVVTSEDTEDTDISLEMVPDVMPNGQADAQVGKGKFEEPLLFPGSEPPGLDNNGISLIPQQLNVDDEGDALFLPLPKRQFKRRQLMQVLSAKRATDHSPLSF